MGDISSACLQNQILQREALTVGGDFSALHILEVMFAMDYRYRGLAAIEAGRDFAVLLLTFVTSTGGLTFT